MKVRVSMADLAVGMFVVAEVRTLVVDGEMRHFLEPLEASYREETSKRLRLMRRKFEQVAAARGLLMTSTKQIGALGQIGLTEVVVDTDKSDILPPNMPTARAPRATSAGWVTDLPQTETREGTLLPPTGEKAPSREARRVDIAGTERRRNFGPSNAGWMKLEVVETDDDDEPRLCAYLQVISFGGDARMGPEDVLRALDEEYGICEGLEMAMIRKLGNQAAASPNRVIRGQFLVASSPRREPEEAGQIEYPCLQGRSQLPFAEVHRKLTESTAAVDTADHTLRVCTVVPGEELAVFSASGAEGPPDIFGQRRAPAVAETLLKAGDNVDVQDDRFVSRIFGYLCLTDGTISVLPPLWISPDRMEAHYVHLIDPRPEAPTPTRDWLLGMLDEAGVTYGRQEEAIDRLLAAPPEDPAPVQLAMGRLPIAGVDAQVVTHFGGDAEDLSEKHQKSLVEMGSLIARVTPATEGTPGTDISGTEVRAATGRQQHLVAGPNVRCEEREGSQLFYSEIEGSARILGQTLRVQPVVYVRGSVDRPFKVKPGSDVYVRGSVRSGGSIEADGTIAVEGSVEGGAVVQSQEDVVVGKGIVGHGTRVVARGDVTARFMQNSGVIAGGDVTATHLMNATVRGRNLTVNSVEGDERSGVIVGGQSMATGRIEVTRAGSTTSEQTRLSIVPDPQLQAQRAKVEKGLDFCRTNILRILRTLGVREIDAVQLKGLIEKAPPEKRKPLVKILTQLKQLVDTRDKSLKLRDDLEQEQEELFAAAQIQIQELVHADVTVQIGELVLKPKEDIHNGAVFQRSGKQVTWSPPAKAARPRD